MSAAQKIIPNLWFDGNAEEAAGFYASVFAEGRVLDVLRCGPAGPGPEGSALTVTWEMLGMRFVGINGGPQFTFSEAVSLMVPCETQGEIDRLWEALGDGGSYQQCGWLKDRFGLSWQIVPAGLDEMLSGADAERSARVMAAVLGMVKLDAAALDRAHAA
jgi:predicted 3-demethylubiquinone-9 3-methyltransferase (glyoxalase superfamily)